MAVQRLVIRVESDTAPYERGMQRMEQRSRAAVAAERAVHQETRETTRHLQETERATSSLATTAFRTAQAYGALRIAAQAYRAIAAAPESKSFLPDLRTVGRAFRSDLITGSEKIDLASKALANSGKNLGTILSRERGKILDGTIFGFAGDFASKFRESAAVKDLRADVARLRALPSMGMGAGRLDQARAAGGIAAGLARAGGAAAVGAAGSGGIAAAIAERAGANRLMAKGVEVATPLLLTVVRLAPPILLAYAAVKTLEVGAKSLFAASRHADEYFQRETAPIVAAPAGRGLGDAARYAFNSGIQSLNEGGLRAAVEGTQRFTRDVGLMGRALQRWTVGVLDQLGDELGGRTREQGDAVRARINPTAGQQAVDRIRAEMRAEEAATAERAAAAVRSLSEAIERETRALAAGTGALEMYELAQAGVDAATRAQLRGALENLEGAQARAATLADLSATMEALHRNTSILNRAPGLDADARTRAEFQWRGATDEELARLEQMQARARTAQEGDSLARYNAELERSIATYGMSAAQARIWRAEQEGVAPEIIAQTRALAAQTEALDRQRAAQAAATAERRRLIQAAGATIEAQMSPLERFVKREAELKRMVNMGLIDRGTAARAWEAARDDLQRSTSSQTAYEGRPAAAVRGTAAAFSASFGALPRESINIDAEALKAAKQQVELQRQQLRKLDELADARPKVVKID